MAGYPDRMSQFWKELKDRNVIRSTTVYVAVVFGLLELIDIISGPLHLPGWVLTVFIFLFITGFPVTIMVSWMFCFTPEGIKKYKDPDIGILSETIEELTLKEKSEAQPVVSDELDLVEAKFMKERPSDRRTGRIYGITSLIVFCLVVVFFLFYSGKSAPFEERDWVVLADFVNYTEEEIFNHSLNTAFEISINQSRHINVVTRKRAQDVLKRIGKESGTGIDEALCREIAVREGAAVYIVPEISRVGKKYILTAELMETESSHVVASEIIYSESKDEILNKLDRMTRKMRRHLGESRFKISGQNKPLEEATTSSLDALKQFSLGIESHIRMEFNNAVTYYENAIRLDSNFTAAKASLGNILYEHFEREEGKIWLDEAIKSIDNLTESERLGIMAFYAVNVEKDVDKGIEITRMLVDLYPDLPLMRNNLGWYLQNRGDYLESIVEYKEAIRLDPYLMIPYAGLISNYLRYLGQIDSALYWTNRMIQTEPENGWGYFYLGSCYFGLDEYEKAQGEYEKAKDLAPGVFLIMYRLAHTYRTLEKYEEAITVLNEILQSNKQESPAYYNLGLCYSLMGEENKARENYLIYKSFTEFWEKQYPDNPTTFLSKGSVLTWLGEKEEGLEAGKKGIDLDTSNHFNIARFLAVQDKKSEALDHLQTAIELGYRQIVWIKMEPDIGLLKDEPRFQQLMKQYFN